jgi:hypothetical protein
MVVTPDTLTRQMTEKALQQCVMDTARLFGWLAFHVYDSRHSPAGFPDTVLVKGGRLLFCELKRDGKKLAPAQWEWSAALTVVSIASGGVVSWHLWRPTEWRSGEIERVLREG